MSQIQTTSRGNSKILRYHRVLKRESIHWPMTEIAKSLGGHGSSPQFAIFKWDTLNNRKIISGKNHAL